MKVIVPKGPTYTQPRKITAAIQMAHYTFHSVKRDPLIKDNSKYVSIILSPPYPPPTPPKKKRKKRERESDKLKKKRKKSERILQIWFNHLLKREKKKMVRYHKYQLF